MSSYIETPFVSNITPVKLSSKKKRKENLLSAPFSNINNKKYDVTINVVIYA